MVRLIRTKERPICQAGTVVREMRKFISKRAAEGNERDDLRESGVGRWDDDEDHQEAEGERQDEEHVELLKLLFGVGHGAEGGGDAGVDQKAEDEVGDEEEDLRGADEVHGRLPMRLVASDVEPRIAAASIQTPTCVMPTEPTPRILPASISSGLMVESMTSKTRLVFSSMMERAVFMP